MNKDERLMIYNSELPHGYQKIVAEKAGVSRQTVCKFLQGKSDNFKVEEIIIKEIASIRKVRKDLLKENEII